MAKDIVIPKLGMTMKEAKVVEWTVPEGEWVEPGKILLVIETEKVTYEVEALDAGFVHIEAGPDDVVAVGEPVGRLADTEDELAQLQKESPTPAGAGAEAAPAVKPAGAEAAPAGAARTGGRIFITPVAKKIAAEHGLDISRIKGTGPGGRIKRADVEKALAEGTAAPVAAAAATVPAATGEMVGGLQVKDTLPLTGIRGIIAEHMHQSLAESAQLTTMGEFDVTEFVRLRKSLVEREMQLGVRISYTDILVYIVARALVDNPILNASLVDGEIKMWENVNIGVAVSLPWDKYDAGLVVPVVRDAHKKTLSEISRELKELRTMAYEGRLGLEHITEGTFTISNIGGFGEGYTFTTPVISRPQAAILGAGSIIDRPLVVNGEIVIRPVMNWFLTFDHRVVNGAPVGKFLGRVYELMQNPGLMLA